MRKKRYINKKNISALSPQDIGGQCSTRNTPMKLSSFLGGVPVNEVEASLEGWKGFGLKKKKKKKVMTMFT